MHFSCGSLSSLESDTPLKQYARLDRTETNQKTKSSSIDMDEFVRV